MNAQPIKAINKIRRKKNNQRNKPRRWTYNLSKQITPKPKSEIITYRKQPEIGTRINVNPIKLRSSDTKLAEQFRALKLTEYLYGALHPAQAVHEGLDVKLPSDLPVPTACIRVTYTATITTGANGFLFLNYIPGSLIGTNISNGEVSTLTANITCNGSGTVGTNSFVRVPFRAIPQVYDRWRLTASEMNLQYCGTVLNQSGVMHSCVHYEVPTFAYKGTSGTSSITSMSNGNLDRLSSNYDLVKQGLWNETIDISQRGSGITHIYTPSSIDDYEFSGRVTNSANQFTTIVANTSQSFSDSTSASVAEVNTTFARQYCWACSNLPPNTPNMLFTVSEVYEYYPDIGSVPILKLSEDSPNHKEYSSIQKVLNEPKKIKTTWSKFKNIASNIISKVGKYVDYDMLFQKLITAAAL
jgi:hypothetical protein